MADAECDTCGKIFTAGWKARDNHCRATGHSPRLFECHCCYEEWDTVQERVDHEVSDHHYCAQCDRSFSNYNCIKMHLNSRVHRGCTIECPFCERGFATATGVTHHLESGACPGARGLSRDKIYRIVRYKDPKGVISKNLIGWMGSSEYEASEQSWNGYAYECYFCHRCFNRLSSLNQHLSSPAHQQALYHCPQVSCNAEFKSLAAIVNHMESEACGFTRFENVQRRIGDMVSGNRLISF